MDRSSNANEAKINNSALLPFFIFILFYGYKPNWPMSCLWIEVKMTMRLIFFLS